MNTVSLAASVLFYGIVQISNVWTAIIAIGGTMVTVLTAIFFLVDADEKLPKAIPVLRKVSR